MCTKNFIIFKSIRYRSTVALFLVGFFLTFNESALGSLKYIGSSVDPIAYEQPNSSENCPHFAYTVLNSGGGGFAKTIQACCPTNPQSISGLCTAFSLSCQKATPPVVGGNAKLYLYNINNDRSSTGNKLTVTCSWVPKNMLTIYGTTGSTTSLNIMCNYISDEKLSATDVSNKGCIYNGQ